MKKFMPYIFTVLLLQYFMAGHAQQPGDSVDYNVVTGDIIIKPGANVESIVKSRMFVTVSVNKKSVFVGEPVLVTYRFYTALNSKSQVARHPQFINCSVAEMPYSTDPYIDSFKGNLYTVYIIRRVALTPLQAGNLLLGSAYVDNIAELINVEDPFHPQQYSITLSNQPQVVPVYALPAKSKPVDFSGITGRFSIMANATSSTIAAGENDHLIVTIKGAGNIAAIGLPPIQWPANTEHFDASDTQHIQTDSFPVSGDKTFDIPFIGKQAGKAVIPPIEFIFFNPALQKYSYVHTDSIKIDFTDRVNNDNAFNNIISTDITNRKYLWIVAGIALVVLVSFLTGRKKNKQKNTPANEEKRMPVAEEIPPVIREKINFETELQRINAIDKSAGFFKEAKQLILQALEEKLNMYGATEQSLLTATGERLGGADLKNSIHHFMWQYNMALYSPAQHDTSEIKILLEKIITGLKL